LASLAGGLTADPAQLIIARAVMGLGAAMVFPSTLSMLTNVFTERSERARAIGLWGAITGAAIALGPIVGGWLLQAYDWRSIFFAMTPIAAVAGLLVARYLPPSRDPHAPRADRGGFVLSTAAVALLVYTIIEAPAYGWGNVRSVGGFALTAVLVAAFVARERRTDEPMLDVDLFRNPRFTAASGSVAISFFALSGFIFLVTQYFQFLKHYGPLSTGVRLLPVASLVAISSIVGTKLAVRVGTKLVVATGLMLMAGFFLWVTSASTATSYGTIVAQMVVLGAGMGLTSAPATEAIMGVVPTAKAGVGSAVNDTTRLLGGTLGVAVIGSVYASLYASGLTRALPAGLPAALTRTAHGSLGAALTVSGRLAHAGHAALATAVHGLLPRLPHGRRGGRWGGRGRGADRACAAARSPNRGTHGQRRPVPDSRLDAGRNNQLITPSL